MRTCFSVRSDLPKLPQYLPRPLSPDIDVLLQKRLRQSRCRLQLGLLLMRNTGLRIGELLRLSHRCVRSDTRGHNFLKVPLGKLDTERLVPLDAKTLRLVRRLQRLGRWPPRLLSRVRRSPHSLLRDEAALRKACHGLTTPEPITSHRLRHTYATTLLAGGMSLVAIMRLLGHRDYRMTLRYAAITDETVVTEYHCRSPRQRAALRSPIPFHRPSQAVTPSCSSSMSFDSCRRAAKTVLSTQRRIHRRSSNAADDYTRISNGFSATKSRRSPRAN